MPSQLILFCTYGFAWWLLRKDLKWRQFKSTALLIPELWIAILASRPISTWLGGGGAESDMDSNVINTLTFGLLIFLALIVLNRRGVDWGGVIGNNKALFLMFLFLG